MLPNINGNFIPGSFMILNDNGQIVFGLMLMSITKGFTCNNKYDMEKQLVCFICIAPIHNNSCLKALKYWRVKRLQY